MVKRYVIPALSSKNLTLMHIGEEDFAAMKKSEPRQRADFIIHFVVSGNGIYLTKNDKTETENIIRENTAFAIYKYDSVYYHSDDNQPLHYMWIAFDGDESEKILDYIGFSRENPVITVNNQEKIVNAFNELFSALDKNEKYPLFAAFFHLVTLLKENNPLTTHWTSENHDTIFSRAIQYIKTNIYKNIKVKDLVEYLHIDQSYFTKTFKKRFHVLPHIYITKARLQYAEFLVKTTNKTITEIVDTLNFTDVYSFSKLFKKEFGLSPTAYRKLIIEQNKQ